MQDRGGSDVLHPWGGKEPLLAGAERHIKMNSLEEGGSPSEQCPSPANPSARAQYLTSLYFAF